MTPDPRSPDPKRPDPVQPANAEALALVHQLLTLDHAALAWEDPDTGTPGISRIAFARDPEVGMLTLVSGLAPHFRALRDRPDCALMLGDVGGKGDPLTHPRLMIRARASFVAPDDPARPGLRARWLERNPKATIYIDLSDFAFVRLTPISALLNGGFARAYHIAPGDL
ncbi:pyridoxamine 5-phosphate oxidase [Tabrizicola sp.]|uniref:pyridoxamine 5-phosphate oxidase n=1 Tax=Tabrizicola sp. TaxID=2005166 RepID=UPI002734CC3C|nr:pyridoxamine 5-phosphate oxidase [Tabrizicola sp.]MDP3196040.1 pyridoxamine 5-phosphate oxidase [Tabrizicola sp.]